jgi:hypothetical protein
MQSPRTSAAECDGNLESLLEQVGHSNPKTTSGYTHVDDAFRQRMTWVQGLFSQEDGPNGPNSPDFPGTGRVM